MTDDFAGMAIAGLDIDGLDNGGLDIDELDIAGRIYRQLTELELLNSILEKIFAPFRFLKHSLFYVAINLAFAVSCTL